MIPFFRKIRKKMADDNKPMKYMRYAIGEIVLVVIGILIALQINNWKQIKKNKVEERYLIGTLKEELLQNKEEIIKIKDHYAEIVNSNKKLMELIGKNPSYINKFNVDSLMAVSISIDNYIPSNYVLNNMVSTGKLNLISSERLRILLYEWTQELGQKENAYEMLYKYFMESMIPYLSQNASLRNIDLYTVSDFISEPSVLSNNSVTMFQNIVFENHLDNFHYTVSKYMDSLIILENLIDQILSETERNKISKG